MVKRKSVPKARLEAGYAARNEPLVNDTTISESSEEEQPAKAVRPSTSKATTKSTQQHKFKATEFKARAKSGTVALKEINRLQQSVKHIIPKAPFLRVVKEIVFSRGTPEYRFTEMAVEALREASENVLTSLFEDSYLLALHAKRVTLMPRDIALCLNLRHEDLRTK